MGEISGVPTADLNNVDGFFTTQGGGITPEPIATSGAQFYGSASIWSNPNVPATFGIGPAYTTNTFVKVVGVRNYDQFHALKADGTLWYWSISSSNMSTGSFTNDGTWRQYGSDTDWTDICSGRDSVGAIKDGDYYFLGNGAYRQRGDGSTSSVSNWTSVNTSGDWETCVFGYRSAFLTNTSGHVYATGYGYDYQTGQGSTSTISTLTREQNNLTSIIQVACGRRNTSFLNSSGDVYFTGNNEFRGAGPQISSSSDQNGPNLAVNNSTNYNCAKLGDFAYDGGCHIDSDGYLRFHGEGSSYLRPDGSTGDAKNGNAGLRLDSVGTGWTFYSSIDYNGTSSEEMFVAIKSGALWVGGIDSQEFKPVFSATVDSLPYQIRTGVTTAFQALGKILGA